MTEMRLFTPGPTTVPEAVRAETARPMIHHRCEDFAGILTGVRGALARLLCLEGEIALFASSGTGGMEASVASLLKAGEEVVVVVGGKFGERWRDLALHYGLKTRIVDVEWGRAADPNAVIEAVTPSTAAVLIQACESSTGAYHPVAKIGAALGDRDVLLVVDAITAVGVHDLDMAKDRIDVLVGGSQKALMCPPGLAIVALGGRALDRMNKLTSRSYYFSLSREIKNQKDGKTAFTPAISLVRGLSCALDMIEAEGRQNVFARHRLLQKMARAAMRADDLKLFNRDEEATWGITVMEAPHGVSVKSWLKELRSRHHLWLAGGQGELEGRIFRLAHMGACGPDDLLWAVETMENALSDTHPACRDHAGLAFARKILEEGRP